MENQKDKSGAEVVKGGGTPRVRRRTDPKSLAEEVAAVGSECPIPFTHDRLFETHHWWHEMARNYHEPTPFRYAMGAYIQAARNVTFMLQKEKGVFSDFSWYSEWVERAKKDPVMCWLSDIRTGLVHQQALEPDSWLEMRCLGNPRIPHGTEEDPFRREVSPFQCTHFYMHLGPLTDHAHEYMRYWGLESLKGRELLDACADVYDRLDDLVGDAHRRLGKGMVSHQQKGSKRMLPCMEDIMRHRIARTSVREGREIWTDEPPGLHEH